MKVLALILATLITSACVKNSGSRDKKQTPNPVCGESLLCLPQVSWTFHSSAVNFPTKFSLKISDFEIYSSCKLSDPISTTQTNNEILISTKFSYIPSHSLKVEIIDLGSDCKNNAIFFMEDDAQYSISVVEYQNTRRKQVDVYLNN